MFIIHSVKVLVALVVIVGVDVACAAKRRNNRPPITTYPSIAVAENEYSIGKMIGQLLTSSALALGIGGGLFLGHKAAHFILDNFIRKNSNGTVLRIDSKRSDSEKVVQSKVINDLKESQAGIRANVDSLLRNQDQRLKAANDNILTIQQSINSNSKDFDDIRKTLKSLSDRVASAESSKDSRGLDEINEMSSKLESVSSKQKQLSAEIDEIKNAMLKSKSDIEDVLINRDREILEKIRKFGEEIKQVIREEKKSKKSSKKK